MTGSGMTGRPGGIPFRLRIGVIGHIRLTPSGELRQAVDEAIDLAIAETGYRAASMPGPPVTLTVVSSLAEGADRIVAGAVLARAGSRLVSVLPVYEEDLGVYLGDFADEASREEFRRLYDRSWRRVFPPPGAIPDGAGSAARVAGYLWAAQAVAQNCDVLLALWDGEGSRGTAGTADTIERLRRMDTRLAPGTAGPLRIIVPTKGDPAPRLDDAPPFDVAAAAVRDRLGRELRNLSRRGSHGQAG